MNNIFNVWIDNSTQVGQNNCFVLLGQLGLLVS